MQNVQCQNMTYRHQEGLMSNVRAGVLYLWSRISFNWTFCVYTSKSNTEFQDSFMSLRAIFDLSFYQKLVAGQHQVKKCKYKLYFRNETLLQVLLLNAEGQNAFCHKTSIT